jgi:hypothetical protein
VNAGIERVRPPGRLAAVLVLSIAAFLPACRVQHPRLILTKNARELSWLKANDWPATVWAFTPPVCTANIVGPNVVLLAGHCLNQAVQQQPIEVMGQHGTCFPYGSQCSGDTDLAFCKMDQNIPLSPFETLPGAGASLATGAPLELAGYGGATMLTNPIQVIPGANVTGPANNEGCREVGKPVNSGDSGGGAFLLGQGQGRTLVGVISAMDGANSSWIVDLTSGPAQDRIQKFVNAEQGAMICGWNYHGTDCRPAS